MFEYITGMLADATPQKAIVEAGGIGYCLFISLATYEKLPKSGNQVKIYTSVVIREDSHKIFGFLHRDERDFFETLCEISGIGPRLAIAILGHMTIQDLHIAVDHHNAKAISKIPGIGKKMAERLILELGDKFGKANKENISLSPTGASSSVGDAIRALINLGYNPLDAQNAVKAVSPPGDEIPLPELISLALKGKKG